MIKSIENRLKLYNYSGDCRQVTLWLLQKLTGLSYVQVLTNNIVVSQEQEAQLSVWIKEITEKHKPIQYILGSVPFCNLDIFVEPPILIPRPETEEWVSELIEALEGKNKDRSLIHSTSLKLHRTLRMNGGEQFFQKSKDEDERKFNILDLCTGSGCIALSLAKAFPQAEVIGSDIFDKAIKLAQKNKEHTKIKNVSFIQSDLFTNIPKQKFDLIVSNPPYISEDEWKDLDPSVRKWEDKLALSSADNGLFLIKRIIKEAAFYLSDGGKLVIEIDRLQGEAVCTFMKSCGYTDVNVKKDFAGLDRVVTGSYVSVK